MNFIYVIHMLQWQRRQQKGARRSRAPPFVVFVAAVVSVASVATAVCDQVVTVQHVDDIDEVHQLDPVHQVDHKDELWGDPGRTFGVFSSKSSHFVPLWARSSFFLRSRQFSAPGVAGKCQKTITEITGGPNVLFFASNFANSELNSGSWELITRSRGSRRSRGFPGSGTEAADRTLGNTRRSLRMT